ncbi:alpha/beta hydrolase [Pseudomonas typographi]|uniref:Alpha/beta hydrolase n=1 Tax=Pseudomonas typographi TaxID=2715964 RepID=A0ABR7Z4D1_9PSED|nr:alpha/beta fold hydrolase [Pseudomonas typographi]MBD1588218.1 alpha/beta hydrolase [Pseudomonas typographi]MBD1600189.1 alpha/beta hydrolase [Pseudomonas typographi]
MLPALFRRRRARLLTGLTLALALALPYGCSRLAYKERELIFSIEPGTASWFGGLPPGVEQLNIALPSNSSSTQYIHAWWWPAAHHHSPAVLYLHGTRWNLTAQLRRITQLRELGFSVLAIDYRGFGDSPGDLPSERSVYQDAQAGWQRLAELQPDPTRRFIYGHSLGGAIAVDLAQRIGDGEQPKAAGLIVESTFTNMGDAAQAVINTSLPVRWLLSEKFDSIDKIAHIAMPVLIVHGTDDKYVPDRFSQALYAAANTPKELLLVPGGTHNNSMIIGSDEYAKALRQLFGLGVARN